MTFAEAISHLIEDDVVENKAFGIEVYILDDLLHFRYNGSIVLHEWRPYMPSVNEMCNDEWSIKPEGEEYEEIRKS